MRYERADFEWTAISSYNDLSGRHNRHSGANRLERGFLGLSTANNIQVQTSFSRSRSGGHDRGRPEGSFGLRAQANLLNAIKLVLSVQSYPKKYSRFRHPQISATNTSSHPSRGALAIVTNVGMGCGGRGSVGRERDRRAKSFGLRERSSGAQDERRSSLASQNFGGGALSGEATFARTGRVRQNRVVLAPVAGVKSAEVSAGPTGLAKPLIRR